ncbi:hypothetical protein EWU23_10555 [Cytophagaceae bacterium 50C-KIRBA]|uniref:ABC-three component systems C-terminal domain-containing protein n=1 Tax=Aquirufa beregesia TaxID=2516556 RepID=A0ABX0F098_9BACT|nr:ABC-three component system protein [Aquirufa beregesia]NGZ44916.1 hypothetical protein [Aquirufa beregesia]
MSNNNIEVNDSSVGGRFTGRDDNSFNISNTYERSFYLHDLYEKFQKEMEADKELKVICEDLDYLNSQVENEEMIGLENKLIAGAKPPMIIRYAKYTKEKFHKKLMLTSQYSVVAQDINVYILSKIHRGFMMEIYTLICNNEDESKIQAAIAERIINPVKAELGLNLFKYDEDDIMGMIFFLTGNCHIKWTA